VTVRSLYSHETLLLWHLRCLGFFEGGCVACRTSCSACLSQSMPTQGAPSTWPTICLKTWSSLIWDPNHTSPLAGHCSLPFLIHASCCSPGMRCSPCIACATLGCFIVWDLTHHAAALLIPLRLVSVLLCLVLLQHDICCRPQIWPQSAVCLSMCLCLHQRCLNCMCSLFQSC